MPLRSIIAYRGANQPKTSSILKLTAQSPFQKMSRKTYFQKMCWANFVNFSHALRVRKCICSFHRNHQLKIFKQMPQRRQASEFLNSFAGFNPAFLESENSSFVPHSFDSTW